MHYTVTEVMDKSIWEWFVLQHSPVALFQSWSWGDVQKKLGSDVTRFGVYEGKTLVAVFQTVKVMARRGTFFHVRHGPIVSVQRDALWNEIFRFLKEKAINEHCDFIRVNPLIPQDDHSLSWAKKHHLIPAAIHRMDGEHCWVLDIGPKDEVLLASMRKTTRYEIRRAQKEGVEVIETTNPTHLSEFFSLYDETSSRHGFVQHKGVKEEFEIFAKNKQAVLYVGKYKKKTIAAAIILYFGNQAIYHHGASVYSPIPASHAVQWQAIQDAKKRGINIYNFWGIAPENNPRHPWRGITLFKKGFGGREIEYMHAHDLPLKPKYWFIRALEMFRKMKKGYD